MGKQAKSGELPPQPSKPQQQAQQPAALAVPQVAICPATPAVNESELIVSSQQHQSSTSAMSSSSSVTTVQQGAQSTQQSSIQEVATHTKITQNKDEVDRAKMEQERQLALEQQRLANEAREEALRVQKQLEQQEREQQVREQQMREQQMRDQQMRDQQMQQQQMQQQQMQQQHFQQQQTNMSRTTTETSSFSQQHSLHESNLSMQVKSGGFINGGQGQQVEGYTSSLKPTSEGELIRTQGDIQYSQTNMQQSGMEQVQLRKTSGTKDIKDTVRQSGVFVGIAGDHNALVSEMFDNEKHSVSDMVKHFSKIKPGDIPQNIMPQHYQMQHAPPSLSELQDQAKDRQFSYQKKDQVDSSSTMTYAEQKAAEEEAKLFERRTSLKDFMLMEGEKSSNINIIDPSNILQGAKASRW